MTDEPFKKTEAEEALEAELKALADREKSADLPPVDDDLDARLHALEQRAKIAKGEARQKKDFVYREARGAASHTESGKGLSTGMVVASAIMGGPLVGYGLGYLLDNATGSTSWKAMIMLLGAVAGIAFTVKYINSREEDKS